MLVRCICVGLLTGGVVYMATRSIVCVSYWDILEVCVISFAISVLFVFAIGIKPKERGMLIKFLKSKINNR